MEREIEDWINDFESDEDFDLNDDDQFEQTYFKTISYGRKRNCKKISAYP